MKYNNDDDKKIAELCYKLYIDCMKYKDRKKQTNKEIDCDVYLNKYKFHFEKYCNGKEQNT
jgi:hypothetical protein